MVQCYHFTLCRPPFALQLPLLVFNSSYWVLMVTDDVHKTMENHWYTQWRSKSVFSYVAYGCLKEKEQNLLFGDGAISRL